MPIGRPILIAVLAVIPAIDFAEGAECLGWADDPTEVRAPQREAHTAILDEANRRIVMFAGLRQPYLWFNDLWEMDLDGPRVWNEIIPAGTRPSERARHVSVYDPIRHRMIVIGGVGEYYDGRERVERYYNDVWALSLDATPTWTKLEPANEPPDVRAGHSAVYDPVLDRIVVIGGYRRVHHGLGVYERMVHEDTWILSLDGNGAWEKLPVPLLPDYTGVFPVTGYDPVRRRILLVSDSPDVWALGLDSGNEWVRVTSVGARGYRIQNGILAYDAAGDRMLFANDVLGVSTVTFTGTDVNWTPMAIYGPPRSRWGYFAAGIVFDPVTRRVLTTYGNISNETVVVELHDDKFGLALSPIRPERGSVDRFPAKSCYEPGEQVTISATPNEGYFFDDWDGDANGSITPLTITMDAHKTIQAEFDRVVPTLLNQFDANSFDGAIELRWRFGGDAAVQSVRVERAARAIGPWARLDLDVRQENGAFVAIDAEADPEREWFYRLVVSMNDGSTASFGPIASQAVLTIRESGITSVSPNPGFGQIHVQFAVARAGRVRFDVTDVAGRRVATLIDGDRNPGRLSVDWSGTDASGVRVRPGTYFMRLSAADRTATRLLVMLR